MPDPNPLALGFADLANAARQLGFGSVGVVRDIDPAPAQQLRQWLAAGYHGTMQWLADNPQRRTGTAHLMPDTRTVICVTLDYLPADTRPLQTLADRQHGYIARYALGRDYHKLIRRRLLKLADALRQQLDETARPKATFRPLTDSAPLMEKPLAAQAGLGWIGKNTLLLTRQRGSMILLGELLTNLHITAPDTDNNQPSDTTPPATPPTATHPEKPRNDGCGSCRACLSVCPTNAFPAPYQLDARRCISYLTIEHRGPIPHQLRPLIGNRIFGCDDCQLVCPWNRYARFTAEDAFTPRQNLDAPRLIDLFKWRAGDFDTATLGSPIRRTGYRGWLRNIAVALGNAPPSAAVQTALKARRGEDPLIDEHIDWALAQQADPTRPAPLRLPELNW